MALAAPFVVGPFVLRLLVPVIAKRLATILIAIAPVPPPPGPPPQEIADLAADPEEANNDLNDGRIVVLGGPLPPPHAAKVDGKSDDAGAPDAGTASKGTIVIPASMVTLALEKKDIRASTAVADGKEWGAKIHGVSKYPVGLRNGDVIVYVEGKRTENTSQLVEAAITAAAAGATKLTGRIVRGDEAWDVVMELPPRNELPPDPRKKK